MRRRAALSSISAWRALWIARIWGGRYAWRRRSVKRICGARGDREVAHLEAFSSVARQEKGGKMSKIRVLGDRVGCGERAF